MIQRAMAPDDNDVIFMIRDLRMRSPEYQPDLPVALKERLPEIVSVLVDAVHVLQLQLPSN